MQKSQPTTKNNSQPDEITNTHINQNQILLNYYCQFGVLVDGLVKEVQRRHSQKKLSLQSKQRIKVGLKTPIFGRNSFCKQNEDATYFNLHNKITIIFSNYNFHNIDTLYLADFDLYSYEFLQFIDWPHLQKMTINYNKVTNLQSLIKANLPSMTYLGLYDNLVQQQLRLSRVQLQKNQITTFELWSSKPPIINQDMSFVAKMQFRPQAHLQFKMKLRIKQPKIKPVLLRKVRQVGCDW